MMLAMHKNVQKKAYEEVKSFFESCDDEVTLKDVNNLPYLEMTLKETMRLFPAASMVGRNSTGTVQLGEFHNLLVETFHDSLHRFRKPHDST